MKRIKNSWFKDETGVFMRSDAGDGEFFPVEGADLASFRVLDPFYAKDRAHVFYFTKPLAGADPVTFERLSGFYAKDSRRVWFEDRRLGGVDAPRFRCHGLYGWDAAHVWQQGKPLKTASARRFRVFERDPVWASDGTRVFHYGKAVRGIDAKSFEALGNSYGRDRSAIWFKSERVVGADRKSFKIVPDRYAAARDKNRRWYYGR